MPKTQHLQPSERHDMQGKSPKESREVGCSNVTHLKNTDCADINPVFAWLRDLQSRSRRVADRNRETCDWDQGYTTRDIHHVLEVIVPVKHSLQGLGLWVGPAGKPGRPALASTTGICPSGVCRHAKAKETWSPCFCSGQLHRDPEGRGKAGYTFHSNSPPGLEVMKLGLGK